MHHLVETRRAVFAFAGDREFWVASEKAKDFTSIYVDVSFSPDPPELPFIDLHPRSHPRPRPARLDAAHRTITTQELVTCYLLAQNANPSESLATIAAEVNPASETITQNANPCRISPAAIDASLLRLEATGAILRGQFRSTSGPRVVRPPPARAHPPPHRRHPAQAD